IRWLIDGRADHKVARTAYCAPPLWSSVGRACQSRRARARRHPRRQVFMSVDQADSRPSVDDYYVLALDIAGVFEALTESVQAVRERVGCRVEETNHRHRALLLRPRRERPSRRAAGQRDELVVREEFKSY